MVPGRPQVAAIAPRPKQTTLHVAVMATDDQPGHVAGLKSICGSATARS